MNHGDETGILWDFFALPIFDTLNVFLKGDLQLNVGSKKDNPQHYNLNGWDVYHLHMVVLWHWVYHLDLGKGLTGAHESDSPAHRIHTHLRTGKETHAHRMATHPRTGGHL